MATCSSTLASLWIHDTLLHARRAQRPAHALSYDSPLCGLSRLRGVGGCRSRGAIGARKVRLSGCFHPGFDSPKQREWSDVLCVSRDVRWLVPLLDAMTML